MTALVLGVITLAILSAVSTKVSGSTSAKTGIEPLCNTANDVLVIVKAGTITSSPGLTPKDAKAVCIVSVPLQCPIA